MSDRRRMVWILLVALWPASSSAQPVAVANEPVATFDRAAVPASGRQVAHLSVSAFGRYAVTAESATGTALQLVDRMAGAGPIAGVTGERDGRVDQFLDLGTTRVVTYGAKLATGEARLRARRFVDVGAAGEPLLDGRPVSAELADLEERSWWIEVDKRRRVVVEAAGRGLADLRLWQNGTWLVDASPEASEIEPSPGRPLGLFRLSADLAPGTYRLAAYGGPSRPWARDAREQPLHLRSGLSRDAVALRERRTVSPFGFDRVLVSAAADFFRLELAEPAEASLGVADFDPAAPFADEGAGSFLGRDAVPPVATLSLVAGEGERVVTVRAPAGAPYVLQHFPLAEERRLSRAGRYWISTIAEGAVGDAIDGTAILVELGDGRQRASRVVAADVPDLTAGWAGRFNLLERATLQVEVRVAGEYELRSHGIATQGRLEPFFVTAPAGYQRPPLRPAPAAWSLEPGYYVLELVAVERGIADVELVPKGAPRLSPAPRGAAQIGVVELAAKREHLVRLNERPGVATGIVARELPLDLVAALPLALGPGEEVVVPFRAASASRLEARAEDGGAIDVAIGDGGTAAAHAVAAGSHLATVRSTRDVPALLSLALVPAERDPAAPPAAVSPERIAARPLFAELTPGAPRALDLERGAAETFRVVAPEPALYRIETTGLLATEAALRTRTQPRLAEEAENGAGRNVRLATYLRDGDYQLTVRPRGASAGHLGVELERSPIDDGGELAVVSPRSADAPALLPARATLAAGRAVAYTFRVVEPGLYRASARGLTKDFRLRVEDDAGWPVGVPLAEGEQVAPLEAGNYRLLVLPQSVEARASVAVERWSEEGGPELSERPAKESPVTLALDREIERLWREGEGGRADDRFHFFLPAPTAVEVALSREMEGELRPAGGSGAPLARLRPGRPFRGELARGDYELAVRATRRDEGRRYRLAVRPEAWVDGVRRAISPPAELPISVGEESTIELASFGGLDLKARLYGADGRELAAGDDRPGDWNFRISRRLPAGRYRLRVEPAGLSAGKRHDAAGRRSELEMRVPRERFDPALDAPGAREIELAADVAVVPLTVPDGAEIVAAGARAAESLALVIEERQGAAWRALAASEGRAVTVALPLARERGELRLRIESLDRRPVRARLTTFAGAVAHHDERELERGFTLASLPGVDPPVAAAVVDLEAPGCFRRSATAPLAQALATAPLAQALATAPLAQALATAPLAQALAMGSPFEPAAPTLAAVGLSIPLASFSAPAGATEIRVQAERARAGEGPPLALTLPAGVPVVCDVADGGAAILELVATGGEPVIGFVDDFGAWGASTEIGAPGAARAVAGAAAGRGRAVELWNAGSTAVEARLGGWLAQELAPADADGVGTSLATWPVPARSVVPLTLPAGTKVVKLGVAAGGAALLLEEGAPRAFLAADGASRVEEFTTGADRVLLFGAGEAEVALVAVAVAPRGAVERDATLSPPSPRFERRFLTAGRFRLPVAPAATPARIELRGALAAQLLGADGSVTRGRSFAVPRAGGELRVMHDPGFVAIWRSEGSASSGAIDADVGSGGAAQSVALPSVVALAGDERLFELELERPALVSLRAEGALAAALTIAGTGRVLAADAYPGGARLDAVAPSGTLRLALRALAGESLGGAALLASSPLLPLGEGLGEERLLAAGESVAYSFRVERRGAIGAGVRSDRAGVEARLVDAAGTELGAGAAIWRELDAGDYRLVVDAPAAGAPARIRPAIVGTRPPGDGPPRAEIERYLALAGEAPPPAANATLGEEDRPAGAPAVERPEDASEDEFEDEIEDEIEEDEPVRRAGDRGGAR